MGIERVFRVSDRCPIRQWFLWQITKKWDLVTLEMRVLNASFVNEVFCRDILLHSPKLLG